MKKVFYDYTERIDNFVDDQNVFAHRQVSDDFSRMIKFKNKVINALMSDEYLSFSKMEKRIYRMDKDGKTIEEIKQELNIPYSAIYDTRYRLKKKILNLAKILSEEQNEIDEEFE